MPLPPAHVPAPDDDDDDGVDDDYHNLPLALHLSPPLPPQPSWLPWATSPALSSVPLLPAPPSATPPPRFPRCRPRLPRSTRLLALLALLAVVPTVYILRHASWSVIAAARADDYIALHPAAPQAPRNLSSAHLLGSYLTSADYELVDPFLLSHAMATSQTIYAAPLDLDLPRANKSGLALHPHSHDLGIAPGPEGINPSVVFTPQWASEHQLAPIPAYSAITEDDACLVQWIAEGTLCPALQQRYGAQELSHAPSHMPPIDIIFTWVNGSDPLHRHAKQYWAYCLSASDAPARQNYCPQPYGPPGRPDQRHDAAAQAEADADADADAGAEAAALSLDPDRKSKFDRFLTDIYPLLRGVETGVRDRDYYVRRRREQNIGYSSQRFFDMGELRYAIRTAVQFLQHLGTVHLLAPDFPQDSLAGMARAEANRTGQSPQQVLRDHQLTADLYTDPIDGSRRVGQRPEWLDIRAPSVRSGADAVTTATATSAAGPQLRLHHDWSLFRPLRAASSDNGTQASASAETHKAAVLPSFNSMAIESALDPGASVLAGGWRGLGASDTLLFSNDDFFMMRPVGHHDVQSPLYGLALRFQDDLSVDAASQITWAAGGEWPGLKMASHMLDERFGRRKRRYPQHVHRSGSASLLHEMRLMFREDVSAALRTRFRGVGTNLVSHDMLHNMVVERHREAALWSYVMFVLDANGDGVIDHSEFQALRRSFRRHHLGGHDLPPGRDQGREEAAYRVAHPGWATEEPHAGRSADRVLTPRRTTIDPHTINAAHAALGLRSTGAASTYLFSSGDGYALTDLYRNAVNVLGHATKGMAWHGAGWPWYLPKDKAAEGNGARARQDTDQGTSTEHWTKDSSAQGSRSGNGTGTGPGPVPDDGRAQSPFYEDQDANGTLACTIEWKACLVGAGLEWMDAARAPTARWRSEAFFTRMAFEAPHCGDCLLTHLVTQSGSRGLSALLPHPDRVLPAHSERLGGQRQHKGSVSGSAAGLRMSEDDESAGLGEPHLPVSRTWLPPESARAGWRGSDFSVAHVAASSGWGGRSARVFVARLLQRYAYTMVATPLAFEQLGAGGTRYTEKVLRDIMARTRTDRPPFTPGTHGTPGTQEQQQEVQEEQEDHTSLALLAINDDIADHTKSHAIVATFMHWLEDTFPAIRWKTPFEH